MLAAYSRCLARRPLITNCITSSAIMMSGDIICQTLIEKEKPFDKERTVRFGFYGLVIQAPIVRAWYVTLDRLFPTASKKSAIKKLLCDQTFFAPFIQAAGLVSIEFMKSRSLEKVKENYLRNFKDLMVNAYKVWPLAQSINFFLIPLKFRLVFGAVIAFFWNIYFTYKVNQ